MLETSPASSSSGSAGLHVAIFVFPPRLPGRWSMTRPIPQIAREGLWEWGHAGRVDFPAPRVMYLRRGWKTFARIHSLTAGLVLYFKLMEDGLLFVKVFVDFGTRLKCCVESSSDGDSDDGSSSSSESDEEDSGADDGDESN